jgi:aminobenzoyl-glutamate utilization protein A
LQDIGCEIKIGREIMDAKSRMALPVQESSDKKHFPLKKGFASVNAGVMHACGHDAHAVTGLGVAKVLMKLKDKIRGTVKIIFQPAEETICGAYPIVKSGFLDDVDRIMTIHYYSPWDAGLVSCTRGQNGHLAIRARLKITWAFDGRCRRLYFRRKP